jgi:hypothetical protein
MCTRAPSPDARGLASASPGGEARSSERGGCHDCAAAALAQVLAAGGYLQAQMRGSAGLYVALDLVLPGEHPAAQHGAINTQRVAHRVEAEGVTALRGAHNPSLGIDKQQPFASISGQNALLIDVYGVGQQGEHQALLTGQAMPPGDIVVLGREDLVQADETFDGQVGAQLETFRHMQRPPELASVGARPSGSLTDSRRLRRDRVHSPLLTIGSRGWFP